MQTFRLNFVLNPLNSELLFDTVKTERCVCGWVQVQVHDQHFVRGITILQLQISRLFKRICNLAKVSRNKSRDCRSRDCVEELFWSKKNHCNTIVEANHSYEGYHSFCWRSDDCDHWPANIALSPQRLSNQFEVGLFIFKILSIFDKAHSLPASKLLKSHDEDHWLRWMDTYVLEFILVTLYIDVATWYWPL